MDMEIVFKILQVLLLHKFVQVDNTAMEMEIVFQIQFKFHARVDGKVMEKVDVFHYLQIHLLKSPHLQDVQEVKNQMEKEDVFLSQFL